MSILTVPDHNPDVPLTSVQGGPPQSMHEANIEYEGFNNSALRQASDALKFGRETWNADNAFRGNQDGEDRAATHDRKVRERIDASQTAWADKLDTARASLRAEHRRIESQLEEAAGLTPNPKWMNAVVGTMHDLPNDGARAQAVADMIERGDNASLAALIEAPMFVTRLPAEVRDTIKARVLAKVDPAGLRLRDQLAKALAKLDDASLASLPAFANLKAGTEPGAWKVRAQMAAARNMSVNAGQR